MKLSLSSRYALLAVAHLARPELFGKPVTAGSIAGECHTPKFYVARLLKLLVRAEVLVLFKGPNGGYRLARKPNQITMVEVVEAVDGPIRGVSPLSQDDGENPLNRRLDQICGECAEQLRKQLGKVKISELAG